MICIKNAKVVLEDGIIWDGVVLVEGDRIVKVAPAGDIEIPQGAEIVDAEGAYVGPGFVDIHVHGGGGYSFDEHPYECAEHFLSHGETSIFATLYYNLTKDGFIEATERIREVKKRGGAGDAIAGIYMEGPYMNPRYGADSKNNKWKGEISASDYEDIVDKSADLAKVWAIAPEREGLEPFMQYVNKVAPNAIFAFGHCEANSDQIRKLKKYGIKLQTHCMDATKSISLTGGTRGNGPDEYCFLDSDIYAELICDSYAIHVLPDNMRMLLKIKGLERVILISDSTNYNLPAPERLSHVTDLSFDSNGGLAGSKLTLDVACRNIMQHTNCGITQAFLLASRNPAKALGIYNEVGTIEEGKRANIVIVDDIFNIKRVMLNGNFVK